MHQTLRKHSGCYLRIFSEEGKKKKYFSEDLTKITKPKKRCLFCKCVAMYKEGEFLDKCSKSALFSTNNKNTTVFHSSEKHKKGQKDDSKERDLQGKSKGQTLQVLNCKHPESRKKNQDLEKGGAEREWRCIN